MDWKCYIDYEPFEPPRPLNFGNSSVWHYFSRRRRLESAQKCAGFKHARLLLLNGPPSAPDTVGAAWGLVLASKRAEPDYETTFFANDPAIVTEEKLTSAPVAKGEIDG
jgi:hypothetical protein